MSRLIVIILLSSSLSTFGQEKLKMTIGAEKSVPIMGYNAPLTHSPGWENNQFCEAVKSLYPTLLRYPGGSNSFYWDWERGRTKNFEELSHSIITRNPEYTAEHLETNAQTGKDSFWKQIKRYNRKNYTSNTISQFSQGAQRTQSKVIFVLNIISSTLNDQLKMLEEAKLKGLEIDRIEIGNEINHQHKLLQEIYPNVKTYADTCEVWINRIQENFPNVKIGVVGGNKGIFKNWNQVLTNRLSNYQNIGFVLHYYPIFSETVDLNNAIEYQQFIATTATDLEKKLQNWAWYLTQSFPTWVTEYNIIEKGNKTLHNTWAHGLFTAMQVHQLIQKTNAEVFTFHSIGFNKFTPFSAIDLTSNKNSKYKKTASGISTSLWNKLTKGATNMQSVQLNNLSWGLSLFNSFNPVFAYKSAGENQKLLICNTSEAEYQVTLKDIGIHKGNMEQYSGSLTHDVRGELNQGDNWKVTKKAVNNTIEIPPYSITLIEE